MAKKAAKSKKRARPRKAAAPVEVTRVPVVDAGSREAELSGELDAARDRLRRQGEAMAHLSDQLADVRRENAALQRKIAGR